jgi:hypothetical protein
MNGYLCVLASSVILLTQQEVGWSNSYHTQWLRVYPTLRTVSLGGDMKIDFFTICNNVSNSASVDDIITVSCLFALHVTGPLNSFRMYPYKLFLLRVLSMKEASLIYT